jgi:hypothetical protein
MNSKIFSLIFILFQLFNLQGQIQDEIEKINVDCLQQLLPKLGGTQRIDALNKLSFGLRIELPDSSLSIAKITIILSEKIDYKKGQADGYFNLGNNYRIYIRSWSTYGRNNYNRFVRSMARL